MRNLAMVIEHMIKEVNQNDEPDLIERLQSIRDSVLYAAPENMGMWWCQVAEEFGYRFPDPNNLNEWQTKVIDIWMDKQKS